MSAFDPAQWVPRVLSEYEIGRSISAIEAVLRTDKPIAEVGCRQTAVVDLEADLQRCLDLVRRPCPVRFWTRTDGSRIRYGFYLHPWAVEALDFLDHSALEDAERAWIGGLLFGYRPDAIQEYITRRGMAPTRSKLASSG